MRPSFSGLDSGSGTLVALVEKRSDKSLNRADASAIASLQPNPTYLAVPLRPLAFR